MRGRNPIKIIYCLPEHLAVWLSTNYPEFDAGDAAKLRPCGAAWPSLLKKNNSKLYWTFVFFFFLFAHRNFAHGAPPRRYYIPLLNVRVSATWLVSIFAIIMSYTLGIVQRGIYIIAGKKKYDYFGDKNCTRGPGFRLIRGKLNYLHPTRRAMLRRSGFRTRKRRTPEKSISSRTLYTEA